MHARSIVSALTLSAALALSGPAFAQTMFNGVELSDGDLAAVTERCEQLVTASGASLTEGTEVAPADGMAADANAGTADATLESVEPVNEMANATSTIDLDTVTLEQCTAAGLPAPAM